MTKRLFISTVALLFVASLSVMAAQKKAASKGKYYTGWITDSVCGAKGANAAHADCAKKCVAEKGAKWALYDTASKKVYILDPQTEAAEHAAHQVRIHGTVEGDTLHVEHIAMVGEKKAAAKKKPAATKKPTAM